MSAGYTNEETPETAATLDHLTRYFRDSSVVALAVTKVQAEDMARDVARICGVYREQRVPL